MEISDWTIVFATLMGPIFAVQAQRWTDLRREQNARKNQIFRVLMATRLANLSPNHVEALNAIPIEFYGRKKSYKEVVSAWKEYLDHLSDHSEIQSNLWGQKRLELFQELLFRLAAALHYDFTRLELKREVYAPQAHAQVENEQEVIRQGLARIFNGEASFPLDIKSFPVDFESQNQQQKLQVLVEQWLTGKTSVKVELDLDKP
jgi:hypothetical protein